MSVPERSQRARELGLPASEWMVRMGAPLLMRTDPELALYGRYVISKRLQEENFSFSFPALPSALADVFAQNPCDDPTGVYRDH